MAPPGCRLLLHAFTRSHRQLIYPLGHLDGLPGVTYQPLVPKLPHPQHTVRAWRALGLLVAAPGWHMLAWPWPASLVPVQPWRDRGRSWREGKAGGTPGLTHRCWGVWWFPGLRY